MVCNKGRLNSNAVFKKRYAWVNEKNLKTTPFSIPI